MTVKNNNDSSVFMNGKEYAELIRYQFTDDTRQTLESVTVFLKDRFAEYGYLPETDVIPIDWLEKHLITHGQVLNGEYFADDAENINEYLTLLIEKWRKENG